MAMLLFLIPLDGHKYSLPTRSIPMPLLFHLMRDIIRSSQNHYGRLVNQLASSQDYYSGRFPSTKHRINLPLTVYQDATGGPHSHYFDIRRLTEPKALHANEITALITIEKSMNLEIPEHPKGEPQVMAWGFKAQNTYLP